MPSLIPPAIEITPSELSIFTKQISFRSSEFRLIQSSL